jgi:hypothetical protein
MNRFMVGSLLFSLLPVLVGMGMHAPDCYNFLMEEDQEERDNIIMWQVYSQIQFTCTVNRSSHKVNNFKIPPF